MGVVVEPAGVGERRGQRVLAGMAERRMAEVVGEAQRLGQILVEAERAGDGPADLRDFEAVGQADPEMVAVGSDEHLGLVAQAAEGDRVDDPVAVALEDVARATRAGVMFRMEPGRAIAAGARRGPAEGSFGGEWPDPVGSDLVQLNASTRTLSRSSTKISASVGAFERPDQQPRAVRRSRRHSR